MAGHRNFKELRKQLAKQPGAKERQAKARADLKRELEQYDATLSALRHARGLTQVQLARALGVSQPQVSRIESQADLYLSTLRSYITAMGGDLQLVATFGDGQAFELELAELVPEDVAEAAGAIGE